VAQKTSFFYFCDIFVTFCFRLKIFGRNITQKVQNEHTYTRIIHISFFMFVLYLVKVATLTHTATSTVFCFLSLSNNFFKLLYKPLTFQFWAKIYELILALQNFQIYIDFFVKMRTFAAHARCIISFMVCTSSWAICTVTG